MSAATAMMSIGDHGVLNREMPPLLADVWIDRDLGWLDFNDRVLAEALDERTPLLERAKFLAIFSVKPGRVLHEADFGFAPRIHTGESAVARRRSGSGCTRVWNGRPTVSETSWFRSLASTEFTYGNGTN